MRKFWKCVLQASKKISTEFPVSSITFFDICIALIIHIMIAICWDWVLFRNKINLWKSTDATAPHRGRGSAVEIFTEMCWHFNRQQFFTIMKSINNNSKICWAALHDSDFISQWSVRKLDWPKHKHILWCIISIVNAFLRTTESCWNHTLGLSVGAGWWHRGWCLPHLTNIDWPWWTERMCELCEVPELRPFILLREQFRRVSNRLNWRLPFSNSFVFTMKDYWEVENRESSVCVSQSKCNFKKEKFDY